MIFEYGLFSAHSALLAYTPQSHPEGSFPNSLEHALDDEVRGGPRHASVTLVAAFEAHGWVV